MSTATIQRDQRIPYQQPVDEVLAAFDTDTQQGLSEGEARARLERHGRNELTVEKPVPAWRKFLAQFQDALVILLLVATLISAVLWLYERDSVLPYEAMAIFAVVLLNAIMGYFQQSRAEQAVAALRQMSAAQAKVIRDGSRQSIPATEVVPGDILLIEEGDTVPADARLIQEAALQTAEGSLTGESLPVPKDTLPIGEEVALGDRHNMIFSGTAATYGRGRAVVVATGMQTQMGLIAGMLKEAPAETTPLQKELHRVGKLLGLIVIGIAVVMIATIILVEDVRGFAALFDVLIFGVALAVAAVPEGLPAVVTAVLSLGVQRMARRKAVVRHLAAVETLGSANVIASDKTGTLTKNEMTVRAVVTASGRVSLGGTGYAPEGEVCREGGGTIDDMLRFELVRALAAADRANNAVLQECDGRWTVQGDPTEGALIVAARKAGLEGKALDARLERVGEVPFSSERKLMSTVHSDAEQEERLLVFTKGAPDILLARCSQELVGEETRPLTAERRAEILKTNEELAAEALRTLGVALRSLPKDALKQEEVDEFVEQELVFLGLIGMIDPPREEAKDAVARAKGAGIRPMMITGDHPKTAAVIAGELGIGENGRAITGAELEKLPDDALDKTVTEVSVYARVDPKHKLRIVKALQRSGAVVAMTGDGVNDAPALKTADIGVAMGITGTDVSKEAADMVLTDDNFASIEAAVEEGRGVFDNLTKFIAWTLPTNLGEGLVLLAAIVAGVTLPILPIQILWINMVTAAVLGTTLALEPKEPGIMSRKPRDPRAPILDGSTIWRIVLVGLIILAGAFGLFEYELGRGASVEEARTVAVNVVIFVGILYLFNSRSLTRSPFQLGFFSNPWAIGGAVLMVLIQMLYTYAPFMQSLFGSAPMSLTLWLDVLAVSLAAFGVIEAEKWVRRKVSRP